MSDYGYSEDDQDVTLFDSAVMRTALQLIEGECIEYEKAYKGLFAEIHTLKDAIVGEPADKIKKSFDEQDEYFKAANNYLNAPQDGLKVALETGIVNGENLINQYQA